MTTPAALRPGTDEITRIAERAVYANRFVTVYDDDVRFSDGRDGRYVRVVQSGGKPGVVTLPLAAGSAALVRVYRYAPGRHEWGLPRGMAHGGNPEATARQELTEELGAPPAQLSALGTMTPDSGILASVVHLYAATYPAPVSAPRDTVEVTAVRWVPVPELLAAIASGDVTDGFTLAAVCRALCCGILAPASQAR